MKVLCLICARKGSKGIKNKNIKSINKKKLIDITIDHAKRSKIFNEIVISTDSRIIQRQAHKKKVHSWFLRPRAISGDKVSKLSVIKHGLIESEKKLRKKFDVVCDLDITSPLRKIEDIIKSYKKFRSGNYNILFSVSEAKKNPYFNMVELRKNEVNLVKNLNKIVSSRQSAPKVYEMNASIYFWKRKHLLIKRNLFGKNVGIFEMPRERSIDIDDNFDLKLVRYLLR